MGVLLMSDISLSNTNSANNLTVISTTKTTDSSSLLSVDNITESATLEGRLGASLEKPGKQEKRQLLKHILDPLHTMVKPVLRMATSLLLTASIAYSTSGCQSMQTEYMEKPNEASWALREAGQWQNCLDAAYPRDFKPAVSKLGDNAARILPHTAGLIDNITGIVGLRFFRGRFMGLDAYSPGIFNNDNPKKWNYVPLYQTGEDTKSWRYAILHVPDSVFSIIGSAGQVIGDVYGVATHLPNTVVLVPLSPNTNANAKAFSLDDKANSLNPDYDNIKSVVDGVTDPLKQTIRTVFYAFNPSDASPDSWQYTWNNVRLWAGMGSNQYQDEKQKELELKVNDYPNNKAEFNDSKYVFNAIPVASSLLHETFWGTTYILENGIYKEVSTTIPDSIPIGLPDHSAWYATGDKPSKKPGIIKSNGEFHPNEPLILTFIKTLAKTAAALLNSGSGSSVGPGPSGPSGPHGG
jgi:hypothetical protein